MSDIANIFNRKLLKIKRERFGNLIQNYDFLIDQACRNLFDKLEDFNCNFDSILELSSNNNILSDKLTKKFSPLTYINTDLSFKIAAKNNNPSVICDEEFLPFKAKSFDLIVSATNLNWVNDLPGCFIQIYNSLKADGLFCANIAGGLTLYELRSVFREFHLRHGKAFINRIAPFGEVKIMGTLLQRAKFTHIVTDSNLIKIAYKNITELLNDLRFTANSNILIDNNYYFGKNNLEKLNDIYFELFPTQDNNIIASFEIIGLTGVRGS